MRTSQIESLGASVFFAKVNKNGDQLLTTTSRAIAILGVSESVSDAESIVEQAFSTWRVSTTLGTILAVRDL